MDNESPSKDIQQTLDKRNTHILWGLIKDLQIRCETQNNLLIEYGNNINSLRDEVDRLKQNVAINAMLNRGSGPTT